MALHPVCEPLRFLLGTWRGAGAGSYPTVADFVYEEQAEFRATGRPFLAYAQRTWSPETGEPMHSETGFWRPKEEGRVELLIAHSLGISEVAEGTVEEATVELVSTQLAAASSAKRVDAIRRRFTVQDDELTYDLWMAAVGVDMTHHLAARLRRVDPGSGSGSAH